MKSLKAMKHLVSEHQPVFNENWLPQYRNKSSKFGPSNSKTKMAKSSYDMPVHLRKARFSGQRLIDFSFLFKQRRRNAVMLEFDGDFVAGFSVVPC